MWSVTQHGMNVLTSVTFTTAVQRLALLTKFTVPKEITTLTFLSQVAD